MRRILLLTLPAWLLLLLHPSALSPCSCINRETAADALVSYDAVFEGDVVAVQRLVIPSHWESEPPSQGQIAFVRVIRTWKGALPPVATVYTGSGGGDCGYQFIPGQHYLVFAYRLPATQRRALHESKLALYTDICTSSTPLTRADDLVNDLNRIRQPTSTPWTPY